jgi:hypothetical protein
MSHLGNSISRQGYTSVITYWSPENSDVIVKSADTPEIFRRD